MSRVVSAAVGMGALVFAAMLFAALMPASAEGLSCAAFLLNRDGS